jgi:hypothetical protein
MEYNNILKSIIIFTIIYSLLKIVPTTTITNKDLCLIIITSLVSFYLLINLK